MLVLLLQDGGTDCLTTTNFGFCPQCVHAFLLVFIINGDCSCLIPYLYGRDAFCEIGIEFLNISDIYRSFQLCRVGLKNFYFGWKLSREIGQCDRMYGWRHRLFFMCGLISSVVFPQSILEVTSPRYLCCVCERYCLLLDSCNRVENFTVFWYGKAVLHL